MALTLGDNFSYLGAKPLDGRVKYDTIAQMAAMSASTLYDGIIAYCVADGKNYQWKSTNDTDATLGKWRELASGGGGQTYNDFTGATASTAGAHGLVPAPSAGDEGKVLFGNGLWGVLPSVDLSVLSNEAFQFSPIEKPVGTWTDSNNVTKLVYARTFFGSGTLTLPKLVFTNVSTYFGIDVSNMAKIVNSILLNNGGTSHLVPLHCDIYQSALQLYYDGVVQDTLSDGILTLFYTKTTDSPLPSDVKFAGVTASGEVILERTLDFGENIEIPTTSWYTTNMSNSNVGKMIGAYGVSNSGTLWNLNANCDSGNYVQLQVCRHDSGTSSVRWATVKYTLAS